MNQTDHYTILYSMWAIPVVIPVVWVLLRPIRRKRFMKKYESMDSIELGIDYIANIVFVSDRISLKTECMKAVMDRRRRNEK